MHRSIPAVLRGADVRRIDISECHGGEGNVHGRDFLYHPGTPGITLVHDIVLEPGVSVGLHEHVGDEEAYIILSGRGRYTRDDEQLEVTAGDVCLVRHGQKHSLANTGAVKMRVIVVCANMGDVYDSPPD